MLFVVVLEFFLCWTPLYIINTIALFNASIIYHNLGYTAISFFQLLAYSSSCCNPITYCFMNCGFRKAFLNLFRCFKLLNKGNGNQTQRRMSAGGGCSTVAEGFTKKMGRNHRTLATATNVTGNLVTSLICTDLALAKETTQSHHQQKPQNSQYIHSTYCNYDINDINHTEVINFGKDDIPSLINNSR